MKYQPKGLGKGGLFNKNYSYNALKDFTGKQKYMQKQVEEATGGQVYNHANGYAPPARPSSNLPQLDPTLMIQQLASECQ